MDHPLEVGSQFGLDPSLWDRNWAELSGGEGQRIMLAIGVALGTAEVVLMDGKFLFSLSPNWIPSDLTLFLTRSGTYALIALTFAAHHTPTLTLC